ncbi:MAG: glycosyl transferase [Clostridia bacterium]|nr:glycosyl transferase [Clostridia bacterium]
MKMSGIIKTIKDPWHLVIALSQRGLLDHLSDKTYLKLNYRARLGRKLDLENPQTFNEKMQWLKLYNRKPIYTTMVDKYEVKKYVADIIGERYIIPTLGVWDSFEDIDFDALPDQFVLKTTHDSGGVVVCKNKNSLDKGKTEEKLKSSLNRNYYYHGREWPYKDVKPRIIAERFMQDRDFEVLNVFKIFNFNGEPKIIQAIQGDKTKDESIDYFDTAWNKLVLRQNFKNSAKKLPKPETLDEMLELAKKLSKGHPFLRTDFYEVNGKVYFSEFTFFSDSGMAKFEPSEWDITLGEWIKLPKQNQKEGT